MTLTAVIVDLSPRWVLRHYQVLFYELTSTICALHRITNHLTCSRCLRSQVHKSSWKTSRATVLTVIRPQSVQSSWFPCSSTSPRLLNWRLNFLFNHHWSLRIIEVGATIFLWNSESPGYNMFNSSRFNVRKLYTHHMIARIVRNQVWMPASDYAILRRQERWEYLHCRL